MPSSQIGYFLDRFKGSGGNFRRDAKRLKEALTSFANAHTSEADYLAAQQGNGWMELPSDIAFMYDDAAEELKKAFKLFTRTEDYGLIDARLKILNRFRDNEYETWISDEPKKDVYVEGLYKVADALNAVAKDIDSYLNEKKSKSYKFDRMSFEKDALPLINQIKASIRTDKYVNIYTARSLAEKINILANLTGTQISPNYAEAKAYAYKIVTILEDKHAPGDMIDLTEQECRSVLKYLDEIEDRALMKPRKSTTEIDRVKYRIKARLTRKQRNDY